MNKFVKSSSPSFKYRLISVVVLIALGLVAVLARVGYLQIWQGSHFEDLAKRHQERRVRIEGRRGTIYDRNHRVLASSIEVDSIHTVPGKIEDPEDAAQKLSPLLKIPKDKLLQKLKKQNNFIWLVRQTSPKIAFQVEQLKLKGIGFMKEFRRYYPTGDFGGALLGFTGLDSRGLEGLEYQFHDLLYGAPQTYLVEQDGTHRQIPSLEGVPKNRSGYSLHLTIDSRIQYFAEESLAKGVAAMEAPGGIAIVMESQTGAILAMAQVPGFDPNLYTNYTRGHFLNRAVAGGYEPGSTFKLLTIGAALQEGKIKPDQIFFCENGSMRVDNHMIHDVERHANLSVREIIQHSSNIGASKIGLLLPRETFYRYINQFGFGSKLDIGFPGEASGLVLPLHSWTTIDHASMSFGHGILVSPIQLIAAINVMATGGIYVPPYIVDFIEDQQKKVFKQWPIEGDGPKKNFGPRPSHRILSPEVTDQVKNFMVSVVEVEGTGHRGAIPGVTVAGKTGTSEVFDEETQKYSKTKHITSFVGFLPADAPLFTVLVIVEFPKNGAYGGTAAAPIFKEIAEHTIEILDERHHYALH